MSVTSAKRSPRRIRHAHYHARVGQSHAGSGIQCRPDGVSGVREHTGPVVRVGRISDQDGPIELGRQHHRPLHGGPAAHVHQPVVGQARAEADERVQD